MLSCVRLWTLHRRFGAPAGDRYEWSIKAVMYSVMEANFAVICANLPALGYKLVSNWKHKNDKSRSARGRIGRGLTTGLSQRVYIPRQEQANLDEVAHDLEVAYDLGRLGNPLERHPHYPNDRRA